MNRLNANMDIMGSTNFQRRLLKKIYLPSTFRGHKNNHDMENENDTCKIWKCKTYSISYQLTHPNNFPSL